MPSEISQAAARVRVGRLAADQHGVFHLDQALGLGMSRDAVYRSCRKGEWRRLLHKVFATAAARWQWPMVACLWGGSGSATSHRCAGELWELDGVPSGFVEITRIGTSLMSNSKVIVHRASSSVPSQRVDG
ncbi:MAG TPA: type IV toxin-antitoxin system AbiEi family antitoxin domain-containing protein, partial [Actinomycetota bacterium]